MANKPSPLLLLGVAAILLMGKKKKKKKKRPSATVDGELSRPETDPESAPEQPWEPAPEEEWEPAPVPELEEPAPPPAPEEEPAPEPEGFKCERMLYNGYCIETREFTGNYAYTAPWSLDIWDADGTRLYFRYGTQGFQSEGDALHHAYSIIHEWDT